MTALPATLIMPPGIVAHPSPVSDCHARCHVLTRPDRHASPIPPPSLSPRREANPNHLSLNLNLKSNNPFRNRTSPATSPSPQYNVFPQIPPPTTRMSNNPFLDSSELATSPLASSNNNAALQTTNAFVRTYLPWSHPAIWSAKPCTSSSSTHACSHSPLHDAPSCSASMSSALGLLTTRCCRTTCRCSTLAHHSVRGIGYPSRRTVTDPADSHTRCSHQEWSSTARRHHAHSPCEPG